MICLDPKKSDYQGENADEESAIVDNFILEMSEILDDLDRIALFKMTDILAMARDRGSRVYIVGNGGSAATASHFACDLMKSASTPDSGGIRVHSLVDNISLVSALTNDDGWSEVYLQQLQCHFEPGDVVLAISVGGGEGSDRAGPRSQNLIRALQYAKDNGGVALGMAGCGGGAFREICDVCLVVDSSSMSHVESMHVLVEHLICHLLKRRFASGGRTRQQDGSK